MQQMTIFDYVRPTNVIGYKTLCEHCKHRGWLKGATETEPAMWMCGYANRRSAQGWDEWVPCTEENCVLLKDEGEKND